MPKNIKIRFNSKGKPITPNGYQRISKGRKVKKGDKYLSKNFGYWIPTKLLPDAVIEIGTYIRKVKISNKQKAKTKEARIKFVSKKLKQNLTFQGNVDFDKLAITVIDIVNLSNREITH